MEKNDPNRIRLLRRRKGLSQRELAGAIGAHWVTVSKLERGDMKLTQDWMERVAPALGAHFSELLPPAKTGKTLYLKGYLSERGVDSDESRGGIGNAITLNTSDEDDTHVSSEWYMVMGGFFGQICRAGSIVKFKSNANWKLDDFIGSICIIRTAVDTNPIVGIVSRGKNSGEYDVLLPNGTPMTGVRPTSFGVLSIVVTDALCTSDFGL